MWKEKAASATAGHALQAKPKVKSRKPKADPVMTRCPVLRVA
jgi:hypothetical protein